MPTALLFRCSHYLISLPLPHTPPLPRPPPSVPRIRYLPAHLSFIMDAVASAIQSGQTPALKHTETVDKSAPQIDGMT
jgi:hypothetical protein